MSRSPGTCTTSPPQGQGCPTVNDTHTAWQQAKEAVTGYAVFGQDYTGAVTGSGVDWSYGDLSYVDDLGYTVNTASFGAGAWLVTATDYDGEGNVVRVLDASATATARTPPGCRRRRLTRCPPAPVYNTEVQGRGRGGWCSRAARGSPTPTARPAWSPWVMAPRRRPARTQPPCTTWVRRRH